MSPATATLRFVREPDDPAGIVLLLHGGREDGYGAVRANQLAVLRMRPVAAAVARAGGDRLVVVRLQNRVRGWNGADCSPVADARWALAQLRDRYGADRPVALIGHSMGGRTAMRVGGDPGVSSVVGLAPWLPSGEPVEQLADRHVLIIHGSLDQTTDPAESQAFTEALRGNGVPAGYVMVPGERHPLLRRRRLVDGLAAAYVREILLAVPPATSSDKSETGLVANLLRRVLAGEGRLVV